MTTQRERGELSLSFLDLLSCSLGAVILLFLIFSALEHHGDRDSNQREGLPLKGRFLRATREPGKEEPRTPLLFTIAIKPKDGKGLEKINIEANDPDASWVKISEAIAPLDPDPLDSKPTEKPSAKAFHVWIEDPQKNHKLEVSPPDVELEVTIRLQNTDRDDVRKPITLPASRAQGTSDLEFAHGDLQVVSAFRTGRRQE